MTQNERLDFLINYLIDENVKYKGLEVHKTFEEKKVLLRSLMNVRMPKNISQNFLKIQDKFLSIENDKKGIINLKEIKTVGEIYSDSKIRFKDKISVWQGDITRLKVDAIVNAANSQMLGCFVPCHGCMDNAIHSAAGIELRENCAHLMKKQGFDEPTGAAKITDSYNLPCTYVIHTVGPIVYESLTENHINELKSSYFSCLQTAIENKVRTIAFCCISTGEFRFPNRKAAEIAVNSVLEFLEYNHDKIDRVIFNVFKDIDYEIYDLLLRK